MKTVLLTGASGYLGESILTALAGHYRVTALTGRLEAIEPGSLDVDQVVHAAGALRHRAAEHQSANAQGTEQLLKGLAKPTPVVHISSRGVYAASTQPLTELSPLGPTDSYGLSKWEAEQSLVRSGHPYLILRPTAIYGWSCTQAGLTFPAQALTLFEQGKPVSVFQPDRPHDYLYVKDLAAWIGAMLPMGAHWNQVFNVAGPAGSLAQLVERLAEEFESQRRVATQIRYTPGPQARAPVMVCEKLFAQMPDLRHTQTDLILKGLVARGRPVS